MLRKIKSFILSGIMLVTLSVPAALVVPAAVAFANCPGIGDQVAAGAQGATTGGTITCDSSGASDTSTESTITNLAKEVVNIFTIIVGAASVFMIIYGGFRYITSGGSSEKVGNAKNTLIYAIIGLIIVALAQTIIHFVLSRGAAAGGTVT
jgi:hypothetical protein